MCYYFCKEQWFYQKSSKPFFRWQALKIESFLNNSVQCYHNYSAVSVCRKSKIIFENSQLVLSKRQRPWLFFFQRDPPSERSDTKAKLLPHVFTGCCGHWQLKLAEIAMIIHINIPDFKPLSLFEVRGMFSCILMWIILHHKGFFIYFVSVCDR